MSNKIKNIYAQKPLTVILFVAFVLKIVADILLGCYNGFDDYIRIAQNNSYGYADIIYEYNNIITSNKNALFFPLVIVGFIKCLKFIGITSIYVQALIFHLTEITFSLLNIFFAYKISFAITNDKRISNLTGWALSLIWLMLSPFFFSVNTIVMLPFVLWAIYLYVRHTQKKVFDAFLSAIAMCFAIVSDYSAIFFAVGFMMAMICYKNWKNFIVWILTLLSLFSLTQISNLFMQDKIFLQFHLFIKDYYAAVLTFNPMGIVDSFLHIIIYAVLPISILMVWGYIYGARKLYLFLPSLSYLFLYGIIGMHTNISAILFTPFLIILGIMGLRQYCVHYPKEIYPKIIRICAYISIVVNIFTLSFFLMHPML